MRTPPQRPSAGEVLDAVREHWLPEAAAAVHLPVGFGAHHWRIDAPWPALFVTLDTPTPTRSRASFIAAYRSARELAVQGLPGIHPSWSTATGAVAVDRAEGLLSVTSWREGRSPTSAEARSPGHEERVLSLLGGLHAAEAPTSIAPWAARVGTDLAGRLTLSTQRPWRSGPLGEDARELLRTQLPRIAELEQRYRVLRAIETCRSARRVPTHGEPHPANQLLTAEDELLLVDWETLALAPRERDLASLPTAVQRRLGADPLMVELFEIEWTLSEVEEYQRWFRAPHTGSEDDLIAWDGLREELGDG